MAKKVDKVEKMKKMDELEETIQSIKSRYGEGSIMKLGEAPRVDVDVIPTGSLSLDLALGVGGIPRGRVIEIFGPEASGKTTLALQIIAQAQKKGGLCAFVDAEHALDPEYAKKLGVKVDDILISQPDTGEQALEITESLVRSSKIDVIVIDSVAALTPQAEIEGEMGAHHIGLQARLMSQALRKLSGSIASTKTIMIFTNQLRQKIGVMFGNPEVTPGGLALKFYASVRLDVRKIENLKDGDLVVGSRHRVRVVKNKVAPPFRVAEFDMGEKGIIRESELIDLGIQLGILAKSGAFIKWDEKIIGQGKEAAKQWLIDHDKEAEKLEKEIRDESAKNKIPKIDVSAKKTEVPSAK